MGSEAHLLSHRQGWILQETDAEPRSRVHKVYEGITFVKKKKEAGQGG